jgi:hypothetical protein
VVRQQEACARRITDLSYRSVCIQIGQRRSCSEAIRVPGDDFGKDLVGAPSNVSPCLFSRVVKHACGNVAPLHIRECTFDRPIGLFTALSTGAPSPKVRIACEWTSILLPRLAIKNRPNNQ